MRHWVGFSRNFLDCTGDDTHYSNNIIIAPLCRGAAFLERRIKMSAIISKTAIGVVAALAFGASAASAVTVVNGSFEDDAGVAQDGQLFSTLVLWKRK